MSKPRLLDLFCGAGGASMGYHRAGFEVVGVDINPQRHYPFEFHQGDALDYPLDGFDVIHASPPCQAYTPLRYLTRYNRYPVLIEEIRNRLQYEHSGAYVIENVVGAPLIAPIQLCGSSFGLRLRRHRLFETKPMILAPPCNPDWAKADIDIINHGRKKTWAVPVYGSSGGKAKERWREAMGIDWMLDRELTQAIPPAYTEFIGKELIKHL